MAAYGGPAKQRRYIDQVVGRLMTRSHLTRYLTSVAATIIAIGVRLALDPLLAQGDVPYITLFPTLVFIGWYMGLGPALLSVILGGLAAWYFILSPTPSLSPPSPAHAAGLGLFFLMGLACAVLGQVVYRAYRQAEEAAEALRESEAEFRTTFETASVGKIQVDPETGRLLRVNAAFCDMTGYSKTELLDMLLREIIHPDNRERDSDAFARMSRGETTMYRAETLLMRSDGGILWTLLDANVIRDAAGKPLRASAVIQDITHRKLTEQSLRTVTAKFESVFNQSGIFGAILDLDGYLREVNSLAVEGCGYTRRQVLDLPYWQTPWWRGSPEVQEQIRAATRHAAAGEVFRETLRYWTAEGTERFVDFTMHPIRDSHGRVVYLYPAGIDVTDRKRDEEALRRSEVEYRSLFEAAGVGNAEVDLSTGRFIRVNQTFCKLVGYSADELYAKTFLDVTHPDDRARNLQLVESLQHEGHAGFELVKRYIRKNGITIWVHLTSTLLRDADGKPARMLGTAHDITRQKQVEQALAASESRYRARFELSSVGKMEVDAQTGRFLVVNDAFCQTVGYSQQELRAMRPADLTHPEDEVWDGPMLTAFLRGERDRHSSEKRVIRKDGGTIWARVDHALIRDAAGEPLYSVGILQDITARKQADEAIRESEERFRLAAEAARAIVYTVDLPAGNIAVAQGLEQVLGVNGIQEPLTSTWWHARIHPNDRASHLKQIEEILARDKEYSVQYRVQHADGRWLYVDDRGQVTRDEHGQPIRLAGLISDITERKQAELEIQRSETRFRTMANTTPAIIWTADPTGAITFHNQRWLDYTGIDPRDNVRDWSRLVLHPDDYDRCTTAWRHALETGADYAIEVRNRSRHGEYRWFLTRATPIRDEDGRIREWYGSTTDIHDYKLAVEALSEADRRKDEFLATLAHELRNPLAPLANGLEILKHASSPTAIDQARALMQRQLSHMVRLIDDLMDVSRITRNKIELKKTRVELDSIVYHAVEATRPAIDEAGHQLEVSLPSPPVYLEADPTRLAQVLGNLLSNASKYSAEPGRITLSAEVESAAAGQQLVIRVTDTGIGIPGDMLQKVFDLFTQVDTSLARSAGGLGIGLSLVKRLVEMHGGSVAAHSDGPGRGSQFIVRWPIVPTSNVEEHRPIETERLKFARGILIVDDNQAMADSLAFLLETTGQPSFTAYDGPTAIQAAERHQPEVMLLDIGLPSMSGYDVCRNVRQQPWAKDTIIVALTGWGQEEDRRKSRQAGFDGHCVKPVDFTTLMTLLAELQATKA